MMIPSSDDAQRAAAPARARQGIIGGEQLDAATQVKRFDFGSINEQNAASHDNLGRRRPAAAVGALSTEEAAAQVLAQAQAQRAQLEEAFRNGYQAGYEVAQRESASAFDEFRAQQAAELSQQLDAIAQRFDAIGARYAAQLDSIERTLATEVIDLAITLARQTVRSAITLRPDSILAVVQEALEALVDEHARPTVHLHPDDLQAVAAHLGDALAARGGTIVADASLSPGDCRVRTPACTVDASVAKRWQRALAAIGRNEEWSA